ncbi:zinc finger protein ZPR1-like isoform X1 [Haliotis rufescens]|uniref:zinc finger protein ZPR1-like isoform X1 n=1 Tax=Haliotis rufescens TaxID=6454 RepID=UPI00201EBCFF|nr:zinc finger protein ZPR1-like isoform X1 [Haliotis rufescens]
MTEEQQDSASGNKPLFRDITGDDDTPEITEIESYCVNCEDQGLTRLFLTRIPFFREVIVASFSCDHCGHRNAELQPGGRIQDKGVRYEVLIKSKEDLNRQVVQTNFATVSIPELEFESPPNKGVLTTVEGIIQRAVDGLNQDQVLRRIQHPEIAAQIDAFVEKLEKLKEMKEPFKVLVDDPSGNSFIENPYAPKHDKEMSVHHYTRSKQQNEQLGLNEEDGEASDAAESGQAVSKDEVIEFQSNCPNCQAPSSTKMKMVDIPHFKEVVIMATNCDACGYRDNEVKGGGAIEAKGRKISLKITDPSDMSRDVLKSETCSILIPELDFETEMGTLGGKFTTVEGLLSDIQGQLKDSNPFFRGDSSQPGMVNKLTEFCGQLQKIVDGEMMGVHVVLDDPAGNSYLQNVYAPDPDPEMEVVEYERTFDQKEALGLNDMKTENYETT